VIGQLEIYQLIFSFIFYIYIYFFYFYISYCVCNRYVNRIIFSQVGINETLTVNLEMLCDCECERKGHMYEEYSSECNGMGTLKCGVCECYDGFFGKHCECSSHQELTGFDKHFQSCRPDNTSLVDCSGRGTCACGQCECEERENPDEVFPKFSSRPNKFLCMYMDTFFLI